ncbi:MAG: hypothetical protein COA44_08225 [Arcobacter sp.]|nr:MAG: hypothetical protein COA44_08225 [Arcobacter sp.]
MPNKILVIEDSKTIALFEKDTLIKAGYDVVVAYNLEESIELLALYRRSIILAVVDINLPKDNEKALDYLLKQNIPSIAITGSFHPELREKIIQKNVIDYIVLEDDQKLELLLATINRIIHNINRKVLIVDDSKSSRFALRNLLASQNFSIYEAIDGISALKVLQEHKDISIALIDYEMPKMNGAELTRVIRKQFTRAELSILAISVHSSPIVTIEFLKAGANDFITKPYVKEEVLARISVHIDMIDQNQHLQEEIKKRTRIEQELKLSQNTALSANQAKSNFLANMSHEVRTPMNAILGFVDILYKNETASEKKVQLQIIQESGQSLMHIIDDILDFSKIESGKLDIENVLFTTCEPFELITKLFIEKSKKKQISITLNIDDNLKEKAYGDPSRIKQIYSNLLSNAIKFSNEGSKIEVSITPMIGTHLLLCRVKDYGIGIAKENQKKIFNMFEQEDSSTTRKFGGSGLGLTISRSLSQMMNGKLYVESELGKGTSFLFEAELFKDLEQHIARYTQVDRPEELEISNLSGRVLLVEDNKSNQLLMKILLEELGLEVDIVNDGLEAVQAFKKNSYDLILMDENMPNLNGIEASKKIRALESANTINHTPIIAVTANALKGDREKFLEAGMNDYISKPINALVLRKTLEAFLS